MTESLAIPAGVIASHTGLDIKRQLSFEEWERLGKVLDSYQKSIMWWIGDWLQYGEKTYGETYAQAIDATGYDYQTTADAKWVAGKIELSRRRESLGWAYHREVAALEPEEQTRWLDEAESHEWTRNELRQSIKLSRLVRPAESITCEISDLTDLADSGKKFGTIYADPPWEYDNRATRSNVAGIYKFTDGKNTMTPEQVAALPVSSIAADQAHLHLWTTNAFLFDCKQIIEAWGFEYKSAFVWIKPQMGIGNYWRVSHEFMLLGVRGGLTFADHGLMSWLLSERGEHSAKPDKVRWLIEKASPAPRIELFARRISTGWACWGNEIERDIFTREVAAL